jgi:hypothetical protein
MSKARSGAHSTDYTLNSHCEERVAPILSKQFNAILPVQSLPKKYFHFLPTQITGISHAVPPFSQGRFAIVTDVRRDAVDAECADDERHSSGRQRRVVLTPRRWRQVGGSNSAGDGGKKADRRGEHGISRKPLRRECRVFPV